MTANMDRPIGLVPAAGRGTRFSAFCVKELYPLPSDDGTLRPVAEHALRLVSGAGAQQCVVMVSPDKLEVLEVLSQMTEPSIDLAYVVQSQPRGLPNAVRTAYRWIANRNVVLALPDTFVVPHDAAAQILTAQLKASADLALGVFPVEEPERMGPVEFGPDGTVQQVFDKPQHTSLRNSWGIASWSPAFTDFCCAWDDKQGDGPETVIGHVFDAARASGMKVIGVGFPNGVLLDIGTSNGLRRALERLSR